MEVKSSSPSSENLSVVIRHIGKNLNLIKPFTVAKICMSVTKLKIFLPVVPWWVDMYRFDTLSYSRQSITVYQMNKVWFYTQQGSKEGNLDRLIC